MVPYSPPRISSVGSTSSRPVSYADPSISTSLVSQSETWNGAPYFASRPNFRVEPHHRHQNRQTPDITSIYGAHLSDQARLTESCRARSVLPATLPSQSLASPPSPLRRPQRVITVNSDKTFSLNSEKYGASSTAESLRSPCRSSTFATLSVDRNFSESCVEEQSSPPLTTHQEDSLTPFPKRSIAPPTTISVADPSSPWNYNLVGGLRLVPDSTGRKKRDLSQVPSLSLSTKNQSCSSSGPLIRATQVSRKESFQSWQSNSTWSENSNFEAIISRSPCPSRTNFSRLSCDADPQSQSTSSSYLNFEVIGETSGEQSVICGSRPKTGESDCNYVLHETKPSSPSGLAASGSLLKSEFSRESLLVAPLRPGRCFSQVNLSRQKSRESVRTGSFTSISTAFIEEARRSLFAGTAMLSVPPGIVRRSSARKTFTLSGHRQMNPAADNQPKTTLSILLSGSDRDSEVPTRCFSQSTVGRLCSLPHLPDDRGYNSTAWIDSPECVHHIALNREANDSSLRLIEDQDEHGDGLAKLGALHRHSRTRHHRHLSSFPSDRNLCSSGSSRSNSFIRTYIPTWAKLYYGSGEGRFLTIQHSSDSLFSNFNASVQRRSVRSRPSTAGCPPPMNDAPRQVSQHSRHAKTSSETASSTGNPLPSYRLAMVERIKKQTSSIWSPHLRRDKRAQVYSFWRPPFSMLQFCQGDLNRNRVQTVCFVLGFVFPFAWMFAAFLPLPSPTRLETHDKNYTSGHLDPEYGITHRSLDDPVASFYFRANWWRNLNRYMSIVGIFVIGAAVALAVAGTQQRWKK